MDTSKKDRSDDRHRHTFMVRLPEIFRTKLRALASKTGRPMTSFIKAALKTFFTAAGMWDRKDDAELARQESTIPDQA
jgi:predicted transcriptional regulator